MIVNESNTEQQDVEIKNQPQVDGNGSNQVTDPDPPIDVNKAFNYFKSSLEAAGKKTDEKLLYSYASRSDLKTYIREFHVLNGLMETLPNEQEADSIYNSWIDKSFVEKKNQVQTSLDDFSSQPNIVTDSEQQSTSGDGASSSDYISTITLSEEELNREGYTRSEELVAYDFDSWKNEISVKGVGGYINEQKYLSNVVNNIPQGVFNMSERDASITLNNVLRNYGIKVNESGFTENELEIILPDGTKQTHRLFTDGYKAQLRASGQTDEDIAKLELKRFGQMKDFLVGVNKDGQKISNPAVMDGMNDVFANSQNIVADVYMETNRASSLLSSEIEELAGFVNMSAADFYDKNGVFNSNKALMVIDQIKQSLDTSGGLNEYFSDEDDISMFGGAEIIRARMMARAAQDKKDSDQQRVTKELYKKLDGYIEKIYSRRSGSSKMIGSALATSGSYANIDLFNKELISNLGQAGFDLGDMPTDGIKINGMVSSLNTLQEIILDPSGRNDVIRGKIKVEVDPSHEAYGFLSPLVKGAAKILERNESFDESTGTLGAFGAEMKIAYEWVEDLVQGVGIGTMDVMANMGTAISDMFQMVGMDKYAADSIVFSQFGMPTAGGLPSPEQVQMLKEEYLPLFDTEISDANSFGEFLALANQPLAQSVPYFAAYTVNPYFGLTVTGVSTYGGTLSELEGLKQAANEDLQAGATLTQSQKDILNMSDWEARGLALSKAGSEVLINRLFTFKYFKAMSGAKNFKGPKTLENSRKIAEAFSKTHGLSTRKKIAKVLGVSPKALATEVPEEELVAISQYFLNTQWGLEEWDWDKAQGLMKNTGLQSIFSSAAMAKFAQAGQTRQVRRATNQLIKNNITLESENAVIRSRNEADAAVLKLQQDGNLDSDIGKTALQIRSKANQEVIAMDRRKTELVNSMTATDKQNFLELITRLEETKAKLDTDWYESSTITNNVVRQMAEDVTDIQGQLKAIITRYPSEISYNFLDSDTKLQYDERASKELQAEAEEKGGNYEITQQQISDRAAKLYVEDVKSGERENAERFSVGGAYTISDPTMYFVDIPEDERKEFDLNTRIKQAQSKTKPQPQQVELELEGEGVEKPETAKKQPIDNERVAALFSRFESVNRDVDLMASLPESQANHIIKFFNDLDAGKDPAFGFVESILDANDMAVRIAAKAPGKIDIFKKAGITPDMSMEQVYQNLNAWAQKNISVGGGVLKGKGFATGDILLKTLFRDSYVGQEFYDVYREINRKISEQTQSAEQLYLNTLKDYQNSVKAYNKANGTKIAPDANHQNNAYELYMLAGAFRRSGVTIGKQEIISSMESGDKKLFLDTVKQIEQGNDVEQNQAALDNLLNKYPEVRAQYEQEAQSGAKQDIEFSRWKSLVKQELDIRRKEYEEAEGSVQQKKFKERYELWKSTYEKLGFEKANSFDDLTTEQFNKDFVQKLASMQNNDAALKRIKDYGGELKNEDRGTEVPFVDGTYIPIPLRKGDNSDANGKNTYDGNDDGATDQQAVSMSDAAILSQINFAETLGDNLRLNPGIFVKNAIARMKGANIDVEARGDLNKLMYLLDNPTFKDMFSNPKEYDIIANFFRDKQNVFNSIVNEGNETYIDIGSNDYMTTTNKALRAGYTMWAAKALARADQRPAQFYSAISGSFPYLTSKQSKNHLYSKAALFGVGLSGSSNGFKSKTQIGKFIQNSFLGMGDLSNIYAKSRTGLRNALKAEFVLSDQKEIPTSYYLNYLGIDSAKHDKLIRAIGPSASVNTVLDFLGKGSELSLDVWLASADRAAANAAFEAHYIDARVKQGENLKGVDMKQWWAKENENPNIDAINEADALIAQTMRQTGNMSEAGIYSGGTGLETAVRSLIPFQRFISNARANFANQYAILQDPTVPPSQKEQAKAAMQGIVQEVLTFQSVKLVTGLATIQGLAAGVLGFGLEDEDKQRFGGTSQLIEADLLPLGDRPGVISDMMDKEKKYQDFLSSTPTKQKKTKEGEILSGLTSEAYVDANLDDAAYFIQRYAKEYENKFQAGKNYGVLMPAVQDLFTTMQPLPLPGPSQDFLFYKMNELLEGEPFREFISGDIDQIKTKGGRLEFFAENFTGVYGIGLEQSDRLAEAFNLYTENKFYTYTGEYGYQENYVSAGQSKSQIEKLDNSTQLLMYLRMSDVIPGMPKGDITKFANYLQRAIENEFRSTGVTGEGFGRDPLMPTRDMLDRQTNKEQTEAARKALERD